MKKTVDNLEAKYAGSKFYSPDPPGAVNDLKHLVSLQ